MKIGVKCLPVGAEKQATRPYRPVIDVVVNDSVDEVNERNEDRVITQLYRHTQYQQSPSHGFVCVELHRHTAWRRSSYFNTEYLAYSLLNTVQVRDMRNSDLITV